MFTVYILHNNITRRFYIGSTNNIERRLKEHNWHKNKSTRGQGVWRIIYQEKYTTNIEAHNRELKIKSYKGGNAFKKLIAGVVQE